MTKTLPHPDDEIRGDIEQRLYWDGKAGPARIRVDVEKGNVILSGTVASVSSSRAAENDALLSPGVRRVDNRLTVHYPPSLRVPSDLQLADAIREAFRWNSDIASGDIRVTVIDAMALLEGSAPSYREKITAGELAASVTGIEAVNNRLSVQPSGVFPDETVQTDIAAALAGDTRIPPGSVTVEVEDGAVTLSGTVPDRAAYRAAEEIARFCPGTTAVRNELSIG